MAHGIAVGISVARNAGPSRSRIGRSSGTRVAMALRWSMKELGVADRVFRGLLLVDPCDALLRPVSL